MRTKSVALVVAGILALSPVLAFAQSTPVSSASVIVALYTQLIQLLQQELSQLETAPGSGSTDSGAGATSTPTTSSSNTLAASSTYEAPNASTLSALAALPTSGTAPLAVKFTVTGNPFDSEAVNFGDGTPAGTFILPEILCPQGGSCPHTTTNSVAHTYTQPGTYSATLDSTARSPAMLRSLFPQRQRHKSVRSIHFRLAVARLRRKEKTPTAVSSRLCVSPPAPPRLR